MFEPYPIRVDRQNQYPNMRTYSRRRPELQVIDGVQNLCRLCLEKSEEMLPIFLDGSDGICATLSLRIMICVGLEVTRDDWLPNIICSNCHKELNRYYTFRKKCEVSYQKLKIHLQAMKEKQCLHKAMEQKELEHQEKIMQDVNCNVEKLCDDVRTEYLLEKQQFSEVHVLDLNSFANLNMVHDVKQTDLQQSSSIEPEVTNYTESKEIESQIHDADNPEISSFLSTILVQLGILEQQDTTLSIADQGINNLELVMGDDNPVTLELLEEDDEIKEDSQIIIEDKINPVVLNSTASDNMNNQSEDNDDLSNKIEEQVMTIKWKPEEAPPVGGGGGAWCGACRKWLATRGTLRRHMRVHTGERPFACRDCGRRFAQREVLERHRLVHLERRPFECPRCGKGFTQRGALAAHARAHLPPHARALHLHACTRCPKVFLYPSSLSRHMMMHKGRVYACGACQRQFRDKSSMLRHLRGNAHAHAAAQPTGDDVNG